jgi:membrane protein implicated in regulation of membrane protease activity
METFLLGCFVVGLLFSLASAFLSAANGVLEGGEGLAKLKTPTGESTGHFGLPTFNLSAFMVFLTWFGGVSWITLVTTPLGLAGSLVLGVALGIPAYTVVSKFFGFLARSHTLRNLADDELMGTLARVSVRIPPQGVGEIVFTKAEAQRVEGAQSAAGEAIAKGTEVVILGYDNGLARVEVASAFFEQADVPAALPPPQN